MSAGPSSFAEALSTARRLHRESDATVLDLLLRQLPSSCWDELQRWLLAEAGVLAAMPDAGAAPVPQWPPVALAGVVQGVGVRWRDAAELHLGLADPWDDAAVQRAATALGHMPPLAAVPGSWLADVAARGPKAAKESHASSSMPAASRDAGPPVVAFVDAAVRGAVAIGASDVHFECDRGGVAVKLRVDGVMQHFARMEGISCAEEVISRIKVMAQLDITERRVPQDGRFRFAIDPHALDLRVSIMPSVHGEDAVLRLLDKAPWRDADGGITLDRLGFSPASAGSLQALAALPHGMLLVTGPTGSGKTTTVYALLAAFNDGLEKIVTIEDPVEYELPGVLQIPVNDRKGLTFARGLRSILRHDPDRILVGEIRDGETAEIAVQSALTGHQVFTTVHANSLFDVIGRFRHFGLDLYGFMSALNGVVVQRLLRTVCPACGRAGAVEPAAAAWLGQWGAASATVLHPAGCAQCRGTGYRGRRVIAEVHGIDDVLRDMVTGGAPLSALRAKVEADGPPALHRQAASLVAAGETTLDEVRRVVGWR